MSPFLRKISAFSIAMLASASAHAIQFDGFFTVGAAIQNDDTNECRKQPNSASPKSSR